MVNVGTVASNPDYFCTYKNLQMERTSSGVLTLRFHTNGGPITFTGTVHHDLPRALAEIGDDRANKVLVITGTGDSFMGAIDGASLGEIFKPAEWDKTYWEGRRVLRRLLELETPIVAAVNGPAGVHSEYALLADIVVASEDATFVDTPHLGSNIVPGDGVQVIYEELLGVNRARLNEGIALGMALEGLTAADLDYQGRQGANRDEPHGSRR